jgi:hypothetical protein
MRNYVLKIAGYKIRFESKSDGPELTPSERFSRFISSEEVPDVTINVHSDNFSFPEKTEKVLEAPFFEETDGIRIKKNDTFWSIYKCDSCLFIRVMFPLSSNNEQAVLKFSLTDMEWDLYIDKAGRSADPFEYPLDGLVLYYLTVIHGDIMIHSSGVSYLSNGFVFSGVSGKGKTTMAKLWDSCGARVIHDDRLIIRNKSGGYVMYNTPVYRDDSPREAAISHIFLIEHGRHNKKIRLKGASAVTALMANCIQHNWSPEIIKRLVDTLTGICTATQVFRLPFKPDDSIINLIINEA